MSTTHQCSLQITDEQEQGLLPTFLFLQFSQNELQTLEQAGLDWHGEVEGAKNQPIVLILPGLDNSMNRIFDLKINS